jgi:hypothetical protein
MADLVVHPAGNAWIEDNVPLMFPPPEADAVKRDLADVDGKGGDGIG